MANDNWENGEGVVVPVSLIRELAENMVKTIDSWHEQRGIVNLNMGQCIVAMIAAVDAVAEEMHGYPDGGTLQ